MHLRSLAAAAVVLAIPAWAHHSHTTYNNDTFVNLTGTVSSVAWTNPHVWLYVDVVDQQGQAKTWALEGGSIAAVTRGGWQRNSLKTGDKVTVRCHPLRDGAEGCLMGFVTSINGTAMDKQFSSPR
jgi:hypothetical protein